MNIGTSVNLHDVQLGSFFSLFLVYLLFMQMIHTALVRELKHSAAFFFVLLPYDPSPGEAGMDRHESIYPAPRFIRLGSIFESEMSRMCLARRSNICCSDASLRTYS